VISLHARGSYPQLLSLEEHVLVMTETLLCELPAATVAIAHRAHLTVNAGEQLLLVQLTYFLLGVSSGREVKNRRVIFVVL